MSLREQARSTLVDLKDSRKDQINLRDDFIRHLDLHPDAMLKRCAPGHLTASGLIMDPIQQRVLLTLHPKVGRWLQTGGHCEIEDVSVAESALREAREESGIIGLTLLSQVPIRLDAHGIDCRKDGGTIHFDMQFLVIAPSDAIEIMSEESDDLRWFAIDQLPSDSDAALINLVRDSISAVTVFLA